MGKDQTLKPEVREQLYTAIDDDTNWLINMTENLLAATQLETDRTKLKTAPELLEDLFQSAVRQLDRRQGTTTSQLIWRTRRSWRP